MIADTGVLQCAEMARPWHHTVLSHCPGGTQEKNSFASEAEEDLKGATLEGYKLKAPLSKFFLE